MRKDLINMLIDIQHNNSGATLENYMPAKYETGYQYSITPNNAGNMYTDAAAAAVRISELKGSCGIWFSNGYFYIETSYHAESLEQAMTEAKAADQLTIYDWKNDSYINVK